MENKLYEWSELNLEADLTKKDCGKIIEFINLNIKNMGYCKVKATTDENGHWYIIPNELYDDFRKDLYNHEMDDSGEFDKKYGQYRTLGDLNLVQLYIGI